MFRFFLYRDAINNKTIEFTPSQSRQIRKVLRLKSGDIVNCFDGKGWEFEVQLTRVGSEVSLGKIISQKLHEYEPGGILLQSLPKNLKTEFLIQKATELGISKIVFFATKYSVIDAKSVGLPKQHRWQKIAVEAAEQCGRVFVPPVELSTDSIEEIIEKYSNDKIPVFYLNQKGIWLDERTINFNTEFAFIIGPEGGFAPEEIIFLENNQIPKIKIASNILRSETASLTFLSQLVLLKK